MNSKNQSKLRKGAGVDVDVLQTKQKKHMKYLSFKKITLLINNIYPIACKLGACCKVCYAIVSELLPTGVEFDLLVFVAIGFVLFVAGGCQGFVKWAPPPKTSNASFVLGGRSKLAYQTCQWGRKL